MKKLIALMLFAATVSCSKDKPMKLIKITPAVSYSRSIGDTGRYQFSATFDEVVPVTGRVGIEWDVYFDDTDTSFVKYVTMYMPFQAYTNGPGSFSAPDYSLDTTINYRIRNVRVIKATPIEWGYFNFYWD